MMIVFFSSIDCPMLANMASAADSPFALLAPLRRVRLLSERTVPFAFELAWPSKSSTAGVFWPSSTVRSARGPWQSHGAEAELSLQPADMRRLNGSASIALNFWPPVKNVPADNRMSSSSPFDTASLSAWRNWFSSWAQNCAAVTGAITNHEAANKDNAQRSLIPIPSRGIGIRRLHHQLRKSACNARSVGRSGRPDENGGIQIRIELEACYRIGGLPFPCAEIGIDRRVRAHHAISRAVVRPDCFDPGFLVIDGRVKRAKVPAALDHPGCGIDIAVGLESVTQGNLDDVVVDAVDAFAPDVFDFMAVGGDITQAEDLPGKLGSMPQGC